MTTTYDLLGSLDEPTRDYFNNLARTVVVRCESTDRPTDPVQGTEIYETDTGRKKIYDEGAGLWVDTAWLTGALDYAAPAILGTKPDPILVVPPAVYERSDVVTVSNTSGGWNYPYPAPFPNCILSMLTTIGDNASNATQLQIILGNCDVGNLNGQVFQPDGSVVANGDTFRLNFRVVGC